MAERVSARVPHGPESESRPDLGPPLGPRTVYATYREHVSSRRDSARARDLRGSPDAFARRAVACFVAPAPWAQVPIEKLSPALASVRPRVWIDDDRTREPVLFVEAVEARLRETRPGFVWLRGHRGSGRTAALADLAERMSGRVGPYLCDGDVPRGIALRSKEALVIGTELPGAELRIRHETWTLAPWTRDDCIEYLLGRHFLHVADVLSRADDLPVWCDLEGHAGVTAAVLDELAADADLPSAFAALMLICERRVARARDTGLFERACLDHELGLPIKTWDEIDALGRSDNAELFATRGSRRALAGRYVARCLTSATSANLRLPPFPTSLLAAAAAFAARDGRTLANLITLARLVGPHVATNAVGLLHALAPERVRDALQPRTGERTWILDWSRAHLPGTDWSGLSIRNLRVDFADLTGAELTRLILDGGSLEGVRLAHARLDGALLGEVSGRNADCSGVRAQGLSLEDCAFDSADFRGADLSRAEATRVQFRDACFDDAVLRFARVNDCWLEGARFANADLTRATFVHTAFGSVDFRSAHLERVALRFCDLRASHFELVHAPGIDLVHSDLQGALLSGSRFPGGTLRSANLRSTGLADVDWEGADLRNADFRHASFHLGSARSGLLVGAPALWGSMTGFYDSEPVELAHGHPETIRKANLCHADLVGAHVEGCDFYLVDLRGARFTASQETHFRSCRAILDPRPGTR